MRVLLKFIGGSCTHISFVFNKILRDDKIRQSESLRRALLVPQKNKEEEEEEQRRRRCLGNIPKSLNAKLFEVVGRGAAGRVLWHRCKIAAVSVIKQFL